MFFIKNSHKTQLPKKNAGINHPWISVFENDFLYGRTLEAKVSQHHLHLYSYSCIPVNRVELPG